MTGACILPFEFQRTLSRVEFALRDLPNVSGIGFGFKERAGRVTGTFAWRVYVSRKLPLAVLGRDAAVPSSMEGIATDVVSPGTAAPMSGVVPFDDPPSPGMLLSNLQGPVQQDATESDRSGVGTLGFLAAINRTRTREVVLVSNRHVLFAHGAKCGDPVYGLTLSPEKDACAIRANSARPLAELLDAGAETNHPFAYTGEPIRNYFVDCAAARLISADRSPDIPPVRRLGRAHPLDVIGGRAVRIRKLGGISGDLDGHIIDASAVVETAAGRRAGNLMLRTAKGAFVRPGDSGALIVNHRDEAIGLLWGRSDLDPHVAYACHIHPVLERLGVTMLTDAFR